jgi:hypothetical protein
VLKNKHQKQTVYQANGKRETAENFAQALKFGCDFTSAVCHLPFLIHYIKQRANTRMVSFYFKIVYHPISQEQF